MLKEVLRGSYSKSSRCKIYGYEIVKQRMIMGFVGIAEGILILVQLQMRSSHYTKEAKGTSQNCLCPFLLFTS